MRHVAFCPMSIIAYPCKLRSRRLPIAADIGEGRIRLGRKEFAPIAARQKSADWLSSDILYSFSGRRVSNYAYMRIRQSAL